MKKLILLILLLAGVSFGQAQTTKTFNVEDGKVVYFYVADRNSTTGTVYSDAIDVQGFMNLDSTTLYNIGYSGQDTTNVTLSLEGRYVSGLASNWLALGTIVTNFSGVNDTLNVKSLVCRGSFAYDTNILSFSGKCPQQVRVKAVFNSGVGTDAILKAWLFLPKKRYVSFKNTP